MELKPLNRFQHFCLDVQRAWLRMTAGMLSIIVIGLLVLLGSGGPEPGLGIMRGAGTVLLGYSLLAAYSVLANLEARHERGQWKGNAKIMMDNGKWLWVGESRPQKAKVGDHWSSAGLTETWVKTETGWHPASGFAEIRRQRGEHVYTAIAKILRDYHHVMDSRATEQVPVTSVIRRIEEAMRMPWVPDKELLFRRAMDGTYEHAASANFAHSRRVDDRLSSTDPAMWVGEVLPPPWMAADQDSFEHMDYPGIWWIYNQTPQLWYPRVVKGNP